MKSRHNLPVIAFMVICLVIFGCKKDSTLRNAVITGYDLRYCACCGGLMLNFNGETEPYKGDFFLVENTASELGITDTTKFPVYLKIAYTWLDKCNGTHINITEYKPK